MLLSLTLTNQNEKKENIYTLTVKKKICFLGVIIV